MMAPRRFTIPLAICTTLLVPALAGAHMAPRTGPQLVESSQHIVVAVVEEANSRWRGELIVTDYTLRIEDRLRGKAPGRITVSLPGGSIGDETHGTCLVVPLDPGERYLLFLDDLDRPVPLVGGWQGAVRETSGFAAVVEEVRAYLAGEDRDLRTIAATREEGLRAIRDRYELRNQLAVPPMVFTPLPAESPFSPYDQHQMAYWNVYQRDLFQVGPPTGIWAYGNGASEIGFPDSATLEAELGFQWFDGALSATAWRQENGHTVEADIALNPAVPWTLNDDEATRPGGPNSFRDTILGYLGKAWGMMTPFPFPFPELRFIPESVVALRPREYRLATLFSDDTAAVRAAYGGTPVRDGLISSYLALPGPVFPDYTPSRPSVASVRRGGSFQLLSPIKIENPGTEDLVDPQVEVHLVPRRFSMEGAVLLGRIRVRSTVPAGAVRGVALGRIAVPRSVRPGVYYLAFRLLAAGDEYPANNVAWSNHNVTLTVRAR